MRRRKGTVCLWHLEKKVIFVKVKQALNPHFSKLHGQPAALHAKVFRKLLAGERNVEFIAALFVFRPRCKRMTLTVALGF